MSIELIKTIKEVEQNADQLIKDAKAEAKQLNLVAQNEAASMTKQIQDQAEAEVAVIIAQANQDAQKRYDEIIEKTIHECTQLKDNARKNLDKAVNIVYERVVKVNDR
ncbi:hypothetical protein SDC9_101650 [bioreactor metagenome]|uniref:V-type ATP synthase subunit H n=1 Tax=bioreactor metagenome TaxID=1076179 RepID=A0A645AP84_9ZZZZ